MVIELFKQIKEAADIPRIMKWDIFEYRPLENESPMMEGFCKFCHGEPTEERTVKYNPENKVWYCFKCHKGGDIITYVALSKKCSPIDAAKWINSTHNLNIPQEKFDELLAVKKDKEN
jgi:DNA primase